MIVFFTVLLIIIIDNIFMCLYCRFKDKHEQKMREKKHNHNINIENNHDTSDDHRITKRGLKSRLVSIYQRADHYLYGLMRYEIIMTGHIPSHRIRNFLYRFVFQMKATSKTVIYGGCEFRSPWNIHMDNCVISVGCIFDGRNGIYIGNNTVFGSNVRVWTEEHDLNDSMFGIGETHAQPVHFGERTWICSDSTVLPGVNIGNGAVVASRACITKDCDAYGVYGGVPAKRIGSRSNDLKYVLSGKPHWHFY